MPWLDKEDKDNWYTGIRWEEKQNMLPRFLDPSIDVNDLEENEYEQNNGTIVAKIPVIKGRISRRSPSDRNETYIELIVGESTENGQSRNRQVIIGQDLGSLAPGRMLANEHYHEYFNREGVLVNDPLGRQREQKARIKEVRKIQAERERKQRQEDRKAGRQTARPEAGATAEETTANNKDPEKTGTAGETERTVDEIRESLLQKEKELDGRLQELKAKKQEADRLMRELEQAKKELEDLIEIRKYDLEERAKDHLKTR